jgi:hypothetical protein
MQKKTKLNIISYRLIYLRLFDDSVLLQHEKICKLQYTKDIISNFYIFITGYYILCTKKCC